MPDPAAISEPARATPVHGEFDVVVVGGGPAGLMAAAAAARSGRSVLLLERYGFLGGAGTAGGLSTFCGLHARVHGEDRQVIHGLADELLDRLDKLDGLSRPPGAGRGSARRLPRPAAAGCRSTPARSAHCAAAPPSAANAILTDSRAGFGRPSGQGRRTETRLPSRTTSRGTQPTRRESDTAHITGGREPLSWPGDKCRRTVAAQTAAAMVPSTLKTPPFRNSGTRMAS